MRKKDRTIKNINELITHLKKDIKNIDSPIWFRGQSDDSWPLNPSLFRKECTSEMNLIKKFKQNATLLVKQHQMESEEWLFIMRHHGVPTRLLDWTESPLIGLYFAVNENPDKDSVLWALLPIELNNQGDRSYDDPNNLPSFEEDTDMECYLPESIRTERLVKQLPISFIAPRNTPRMQSQLSVFTIHHRDKTPIEKIGNERHIWRYLISKGAKKPIIEELKLLGISKFQLFPELENISEIL